MDNIRFKKKRLAVGISAAVSLANFTGASASTTWVLRSGTSTLTCDGSSIDITLAEAVGTPTSKTIRVRAAGISPSEVKMSIRLEDMRNKKRTGYKTVGQDESVSWSSLPGLGYNVKAKIQSTTNCNEWAHGNGNFHVTWEVT